MLLTVFCCICGWSINAQETTRTAQGLKNIIQEQGLSQEVIFYSPDIVRVIAYPGQSRPEKKSYPVVLSPKEVKLDYTDNGNILSMKTSCMEVRVNKQT